MALKNQSGKSHSQGPTEGASIVGKLRWSESESSDLAGTENSPVMLGKFCFESLPLETTTMKEGNISGSVSNALLVSAFAVV